MCMCPIFPPCVQPLCKSLHEEPRKPSIDRSKYASALAEMTTAGSAGRWRARVNTALGQSSLNTKLGQLSFLGTKKPTSLLSPINDKSDTNNPFVEYERQMKSIRHQQMKSTWSMNDATILCPASPTEPLDSQKILRRARSGLT